MNRPEGFYTSQDVFLREVISAKAAKGSLTSAWATAATSTWPVALGILIPFGAGVTAAGRVAAGAAGLTAGFAVRSGRASAGVTTGALLGSFLGPLGAMVRAGLGVYATRSLLSSDGHTDREAHVAAAVSRLEAARRVFCELQELRATDLCTFQEEIEVLFDELVDDRGVAS